MGGGVRRHSRKPKRRRDRDGAQNGTRHYEDITKDNEDFLKYYKAQGIVAEDKWDDFLEKLRSTLPISFRISPFPDWESSKLLSLIKGEESLFKDLEPPCPLPWYPGGLGFQVDVSRAQLRRSDSLKRLHNFLISETATGIISRQETVSMVPPLLLGIEKGDKVLDMCAAPGSKTVQLMEALNGDGVVVANDIDNARCYMLVHQAKRLSSPCLVVTNHDASILPSFQIGGGPLKFDRVLCDAPCSGDGTLRKNPDIWMKWQPANANNLHGVQFRLIKRGLEVLRIGGRLVYSTCSMNPVEDEAVIQRLLLEAKGSVELVEVSDVLPGLVYSKGVTEWKLASKEGIYSTFEEVPEKWHTQIRPTMFPDPKSSTLNLDRCIRILPHHQNTGGFFVAVLTKKELLPWEGAPRPESEQSSEPPAKKPKFSGYKEDPFVFFKKEEELWKTLENFYGLEGFNPENLLTRTATGKKKNIYLVSPVVREIITSNPNIKIINSGVKVFSRCDAKCPVPFRLVQEGLASISSAISKRRVSLSTEDLLLVLQHSDPKNPLDLMSLSESTRATVLPLPLGSVVLDAPNLSMVGWRGSRTLRAYVAREDIIHFLRLLGADVSQYEAARKEEAKANSKAGEEEKDESVDNDASPEEAEEERDLSTENNDK